MSKRCRTSFLVIHSSLLVSTGLVYIMRCFVTGGSGFVGRYLVRELCGRGHAVSGLAISPEDARIIAEVGGEPVLGTLEDQSVMASTMRDCEVVFHCAGALGVWGRFAEFYRVNVEGTRHVIDAAVAAGVSRLVSVSATAVMAGKGPIVDVDESHPIPRRPRGGYSRSKALAEQLVLEANSPTLTTSAVRPPAIWGEGCSILDGLATRVRAGKYFWINHGHYPYVTCHVRNVCEGLILAAERSPGGEVYFLTDGPPSEFREFATDLLRTQGLEPSEKSIPRWLAWIAACGVETLWHVLRLRRDPPITRTLLTLVGSPLTVSDAKARNQLGYRGLVSREEGLAELAACSDN